MGSGAGKRRSVTLTDDEFVRQAKTNQAFRAEIRAILTGETQAFHLEPTPTPLKADEVFVWGDQHGLKPPKVAWETEPSETAVGQPSRQWTKADVLASVQPFPSFNKIDALANLQVQQTMNMCGLTSMATALSALGSPTSVDDVMWETGIDISLIVNDGVALAQLFGLSTLFIQERGMGIFVRCYHFDAELASFESFWREAATKREDFIWVLNFHSGIAHGKEKGGGHFSILVAAFEDTGEFLINDVHPIKYGRYWSAPAKQIFNAMVDKDSNSRRARGVLLFGKRAPDDDEFPGLAALGKSVSWKHPEVALGLNWSGRGAELARFVPQQFVISKQMASNMSGAAALTLAISALDGEEWCLQRLMQESRASYTEHLRNFRTPEQLCEMANSVDGFKCRPQRLEQTLDEGKAAGELLQDLAANSKPTSVPLVCFDINIAAGCEIVGQLTTEAGALTHGSKKWAAVAGVDVEAGILILADPHAISMTRLWSCSIQRLLRGIKAMGADIFLVLTFQGYTTKSAVKAKYFVVS